MIGIRNVLGLLSFSWLVAACGSGAKEHRSQEQATARHGDAGVGVNDAPPEGEEQGGGSADASVAHPRSSGLPCDVTAMLAKNCGQCHGATTAYGAPMSL